MAEGVVVDNTPGSQNAHNPIECTEGNGNPFGDTENHPEKNDAELNQLDVEQDPTTTGGDPGEGAEELDSQPRGGGMDSLGQVKKDEHDNKFEKSVLTGESQNKGALDCPTTQTTAEDKDNSSGSAASIKDNIAVHTEGENDQSREPSSKPENTDIQNPQQEPPSKPHIQDSQKDSDEPMEIDASDSQGENSESRVPLSNVDKAVTQDPNNDSSEEMEVDVATGQAPTEAKSGLEHTAKGEKEETGQAVSSEIVESEPPVDIAGAVASGTGQAVSSEMVESEPTVDTMTSGTCQASSSEIVDGKLPGVDTAGAMASGTDQAGSSTEVMGTECKVEGDGHSDTSAEAGIDLKHSTEGIDETVDEAKRIVEGENGGAGEGHTSAEAGNNRNHTTKAVGDGSRQGDSQAEAKTKRKNSPEKKDDDDDDDIILGDSGYGYRSDRSWASRDTQRYRSGYQDTDERDDLRLDKNYKFYTNQIRSEPDGDLIEDIHDHWKGNYQHLEVHHGYIQWLFPIRERGLNWHAQELQPHEIKRICEDPVAHKRILTSYQLMLDFYGMKLKDPETGEIERADNWEKRFRHLNRSMHNYLRITRILKCLGEFDYERLKAPFVRFVLHEAIVEQTLDNTMDSCLNYWLEVIKDDEERKQIKKYARELQGTRGKLKKKKK